MDGDGGCNRRRVRDAGQPHLPPWNRLHDRWRGHVHGIIKYIHSLLREKRDQLASWTRLCACSHKVRAPGGVCSTPLLYAFVLVLVITKVLTSDRTQTRCGTRRFCCVCRVASLCEAIWSDGGELIVSLVDAGRGFPIGCRPHDEGTP